MVHADHSAAQLYAVQVIHGQDSAALIFIAQETEPLRLPSLLVLHQVDADYLAVLREDGEDVPLTHLIGESPDEDVRTASVVIVPRAFLVQLLSRRGA